MAFLLRPILCFSFKCDCQKISLIFYCGNEHNGIGEHQLTLTDNEPVSLLMERSADKFMLRSILSEAELLPESESLLDRLLKKREGESMLPLWISSVERRSYWLLFGLWVLAITDKWSLSLFWIYFSVADWPFLSASINGLIIIMSGLTFSPLCGFCTLMFSEEALLLIVLSGLWSFDWSVGGFIPLLTGCLSFSISLEEYCPFFAGGYETESIKK